ncbi:MAG: sigma-54-dependent transcriptional regulator [Bdellovibrionales bacterium]
MKNPKTQTILLVEDTLPVAMIYEEYLKQEGYSVELAHNGRQAVAYLNRTRPSAIVLDLLLPDTNGMEILTHAKERYPDLPVVVVTVTNSVDVAVEAMRRGAFDYIVKPFPSARLSVTLRNALERHDLSAEVAEWRQAVGQSRFHGFVGQSPAMQSVYRIIDSVASSRASVFIRGESGTGKKLAAKAIHEASPHRAKPFIALHFGPGSPDTLENQLFRQDGAAFKIAGGTLLIDDICEMPLGTQARLLHFLQDGKTVRPEATDMRILASTCHDPIKHVHAGSLREDLYCRLNVVPLNMPPLRDREEDILLLAQHFLARYNAEETKSFSHFAPEVMGAFTRYDWPGNVLQLENIVRNVVVLNDGDEVTAGMLPPDFMRFTEPGPMPANENMQGLVLADRAPEDAVRPLWQVEKEAIEKALEYAGKDIPAAAALLQISASALYRKLHMWKAA